MTDWRVWLYPELKDVSERDRDRIWRLAKEESFRPGEHILILASVGAAAVVVRYAGLRSLLGNAFLGFAADFIVAGIVLIIIAGPAYWRRTKRGLAAASKKGGA